MDTMTSNNTVVVSKQHVLIPEELIVSYESTRFGIELTGIELMVVNRFLRGDSTRDIKRELSLTEKNLTLIISHIKSKLLVSADLFGKERYDLDLRSV